MKKVILDTNGFVRLLLNDIPEQANKVEKLLREAKAGTISVIVPDIVIFEIYFTLEKFYRIPKEDVIEKLKTLLAAQYLDIPSQAIFVHALEIYKTTHVSFPDCFLVAKAKQEEAELFTFDQKLKKLSSQQ